jgi:hypothetical protein
MAVDCLHHGGDCDEATITLASQIAPTTTATSVLTTTVITAPTNYTIYLPLVYRTP